MFAQNSNSPRIRAARGFNIALPTQRSELPQTLRLCLCVPAQCAAEDVVETVFATHFAAEFMGEEPKSAWIYH